jgi:hypothetical protein
MQSTTATVGQVAEVGTQEHLAAKLRFGRLHAPLENHLVKRYFKY